MESEDRPHAQAQTYEDEDNLVSQNSSAEIPQDRQEIISSEELEQPEDPQEGEVSNPGREEEVTGAEYVIEKIIDHGYQDEEILLQVKWYGYTTEDSTWELVPQLPRSAVVRYFRRKKLSLPPQVAHAQAGQLRSDVFRVEVGVVDRRAERSVIARNDAKKGDQRSEVIRPCTPQQKKEAILPTARRARANSTLPVRRRRSGRRYYSSHLVERKCGKVNKWRQGRLERARKSSLESRT